MPSLIPTITTIITQVGGNLTGIELVSSVTIGAFGATFRELRLCFY